MHLLAEVDAVQRRHGHIDVTGIHQGPEVLHEQGAQQGGDVQAVGVGIGEDADLAVSQAAQVGAARIDADGHGDVVHLLAAQHLAAVHFPGVQNLAAQRHDGLEFLAARLLGTAAGGVTLHQEQLGAHRVLAGAIGQLARQRRALGDLLALDLLARLEAAAGVVDGQLGDLLTQFRMGIEPEAEGVLDHPGDKGRGLAGGQSLLGLAGELRLLHLHREDEGDALPDVFRGQLEAARQEVAELAEFTDGVQQALAQAVHMGAALGGGNQVDVAFLHRLAALGQPEQRPVHRFPGRSQAAVEGRLGQPQGVAHGVDQIGSQPVFVMPFAALAARFVEEAHRQARAEHRLGLEHVLEAADGELGRIEVLGVRPEVHAGAGIALADAADHGQFAGLEAVGEGHGVFVALALDAHLDAGRQGVHHRDAHAVQAAGELVVLVGELAAGVQLGQDQLDAGDALFRMDVHRHAATVVYHLEGVVGVQDHLHLARMTGQGLVHAVVDDFLGQVVGPGGVGVHARALAHRIESGEDFDGVGVIGVLRGHGVSIRRC